MTTEQVHKMAGTDSDSADFQSVYRDCLPETALLPTARVCMTTMQCCHLAYKNNIDVDKNALKSRPTVIDVTVYESCIYIRVNQTRRQKYLLTKTWLCIY